jgi:rubrerythrin
MGKVGQGDHGEEDKAMDLSKFPIEEVYQFAVTIEQGGFDFYGKLIEASGNPRVKNELKFLRDEEAQHKAFFQGELRKKGGGQTVLNPGLAGILEKEFIQPMEEFYRAGKISRSEEALRFGMTVEQKTIDFYGEIAKQSRDPAFLKDLDAVIAEEKKHKQKLNIILAY